MTRLRILLVDRSEVWRRGLRQLMDDQPDLVVVADVADSQTACAEAGALRPDVAVVALTVPAMEGLRTAGSIRRLCPAAFIVILGDCLGPGFAEVAADAGANHYVTKQAGPLELLRIIRQGAPRAAGSDCPSVSMKASRSANLTFGRNRPYRAGIT